jgi:uncharacterized protein
MTEPSNPATAPARAAGDFSSWLTGALAGVREARPADVPCDGCTACCTSSQFVLIGEDEADALAHIPGPLLAPAPGRPGQFVLGYDERGHCPMLVDGGCSIYEHRPTTCRTYDCRVFAATDVAIDDPHQAAIATRVASWRFSYASDDDRVRHEATRAAAAHLRVALDPPPVNATELAVLALDVHDVFLTDGLPDQPVDGHVAPTVVRAPSDGEVAVALQRRHRSTPAR